MTTPKNCYCGSEHTFENCCQPYILGTQNAPTAEALMRSRYSAYCTHEVDYLVATTHSKTRKYHSKAEIRSWAESNHWVRLEITKVTPTTVTFNAYYLDSRLQPQVHQEHSTFVQEDGIWYYLEGA